jgi:hypothetical protein
MKVSQGRRGPMKSAHVFVAAFAAIVPGLALANSLNVVNNCKMAIWIQQDRVHQVPNTPLIQKIASKDNFTYAIPPAGVDSTRFWPKIGCDSAGNNCTVGQTEPPCPAQGCAPPVDSKLEVSWGCIGGDCGGRNNLTHFDLSQVDGFTLPYGVKMKSDDTGPDCKPAACPKMDYRTNVCPKGVDLSTEGAFPKLKNQDLRVIDPKSKQVVGCFSACGKLTYDKSFGGYNYKTSDPQAGFYCCDSIKPASANPIPSLDPGKSPGCRGGPAPTSEYVKFVEKACNNQVYGYAYDDVKGNRACKGNTQITLTLCP